MFAVTSLFVWDDLADTAAEMLANGYTIKETAATIGVSSRTIDNWKKHPDFQKELDNLSVMVGAASKAERMRIAKRIIRKLDPPDSKRRRAPTNKDLLDWLKYVQVEAEGAKVNIDGLLELIANNAKVAPTPDTDKDRPGAETQVSND